MATRLASAAFANVIVLDRLIVFRFFSSYLRAPCIRRARGTVQLHRRRVGGMTYGTARTRGALIDYYATWRPSGSASRAPGRALEQSLRALAATSESAERHGDLGTGVGARVQGCTISSVDAGRAERRRKMTCLVVGTLRWVCPMEGSEAGSCCRGQTLNLVPVSRDTRVSTLFI